MSNSKYLILQGLQLSDYEHVIFKTVENLKMAGTLANISRLAGRPRTSTEYTLHKLAGWKLIREIQSDGHTYWFKNKSLK